MISFFYPAAEEGGVDFSGCRLFSIHIDGKVLFIRNGREQISVVYRGYLAKPFSYNELISRSKALIRRYLIYKGKDTPKPKEKVLRFHHLELCEEAKNYSVPDEENNTTQQSLFQSGPGFYG